MKAIIWDTETTGLPLHRRARLELQPRIIEFGCVIIDEHGVEHGELNLIIDPEQDIEPIITKITGLTNDDLRGQMKFADALPRIAAMFEGVDISIAHNLPFDQSLLEFELRRAGAAIDWPPIPMCTVQENRGRWGRRPKLLELYESVIGKPLAQTHRALDDCRALAEIVIKENYIGRINAAVAGTNRVLIQGSIRKD